ncbi:MAG: penicillin-binding transpeptidase domain-containing protein [Ginsengibacter sp.]
MNKTKILLIASLLITLASCTLNKAKINNDLKKYFDSAHVEGSFAFLNNQMGDVTVYNMQLDTQRISPASSFKILLTLVGVQTGKIVNENNIPVATDSGKSKEMTLNEIFNSPNVGYFQSVARQIGKETLQLWIDSLGYGNKRLDGAVDSFWLNSELKISPDEQLGLVTKLYFDQLPFQKYAQQMTRNAMLREDNTLYHLSYTTGTGSDENDKPIGWVAGWIEENRHVYFFITFIRSADKSKDMNQTCIDITKKILTEMGFFKGEK